jgi:hypothetical protein
MSASLLSPDQLSQQIRVRLAQERLPGADGVYKTQRGTGRPCIICRRAIEATDVACEVASAGAVLTAHEACYMLWREQSVSCLAPRRP